MSAAVARIGKTHLEQDAFVSNVTEDVLWVKYESRRYPIQPGGPFQIPKELATAALEQQGRRGLAMAAELDDLEEAEVEARERWLAQLEEDYALAQATVNDRHENKAPVRRCDDHRPRIAALIEKVQRSLGQDFGLPEVPGVQEAVADREKLLGENEALKAKLAEISARLAAVESGGKGKK